VCVRASLVARVCFGEAVRSIGQPVLGLLTRGPSRARRRDSLPVCGWEGEYRLMVSVHPDLHTGYPMILVHCVCWTTTTIVRVYWW
jgi:hypothetical protein